MTQANKWFADWSTLNDGKMPPVFNIDVAFLDMLDENRISLLNAYQEMQKVTQFKLPFVTVLFGIADNTFVLLYETSAGIATMLFLFNGKRYRRLEGIGKLNPEKLELSTYKIPNEDRNDLDFVTKDHEKLISQMSWYAYVTLTMLIKTKGIVQDVTPAPKFRNKKLIAKGQTPVPAITRIRVGQVYDRSGTIISGDKMPTRVHWRRGHLRRVATGVGRVNREWRWIEPCMVNYIGGDEPTYTAEILE